MGKVNGIPRDNFVLFREECEWRFNNFDPKRQLSQSNKVLKKTWVSDMGQPLDLFSCGFAHCRTHGLHEIF